MKVKELLSVLPQSTDVIIRRAFGDNYEDDAARYHYAGKIKDIPINIDYANRAVIAIYWWGETGDQSDMGNATAIDIAISDLDEDCEIERLITEKIRLEIEAARLKTENAELKEDMASLNETIGIFVDNYCPKEWLQELKDTIIKNIEALKLEDDRSGLKQNAVIDKVIEIIKGEIK